MRVYSLMLVCIVLWPVWPPRTIKHNKFINVCGCVERETERERERERVLDRE